MYVCVCVCENSTNTSISVIQLGKDQTNTEDGS